jgi:hypothetical protein
LVAAALEKQCVVPVDYSFSANFLPVDEYMSLRSLARAWRGKGRLNEFDGQFSDAANAYLQSVRLGYAVRRAGLLINALIGTACTDIGANPLFHVRNKLPAEQLRQFIAVLTQLDAGDESYDDYWHRDRAWSQRANGWHGHLQQLLNEMAGDEYDFGFISAADYAPTYWMRQATIRLLIIELALVEFHRNHHRWPSKLDELVPRYVSTIPNDPLDPRLGPLRYGRTPSGYVLYSVGPNRNDDGGAAPNDDDFPGLPRTGDVRLDHHFAPET